MRASARLYDLLLWPLERLGLAAARARLHRDLRGPALEIGAGTGLNLGSRAALAPEAQVVAVDLDLRYLRRARRRDARAALVCADAQALPFRDGSFATALETLTLCSVESPVRALAELRRVLRPGGELRMVDHVRAPGRWLAAAQDRLAPLWLRLTGDCRLNRDLLGLLAAGGWRIARRRSSSRGTVEELTAVPGDAVVAGSSPWQPVAS